MPRKLPPNTDSFQSKGKRVIYFRIGKNPRTCRLPDDPDSEEFRIAYAAAMAGQIEPKRPKLKEPEPGTIAALVTSYMRSAAYRSLRATTKKGYQTRIEIFREKHGHRTVTGLTRERINVAILQPYADRPGQALSLLKMLRVLVRHAIDIGMLRHDPTLGIKRPKTREIRAWTEAEITKFERHWTIGTKQRLAFALMLYTGQRRSDVHRMTWTDFDGRRIAVVQQKTEERLQIPVHAKLRAALDVAPRELPTIVSTEYGNPFTVDGFSQFMRSAITAAGLPITCQPHGLRKAAGRRMAEAGCTAREIMSVLGHKTLAEAERYTRAADQAKLANAAMAKMEDQGEPTNSQTIPPKFGNTAKKPSKIKGDLGKVALPREGRKDKRRQVDKSGLGDSAPVDPKGISDARPNLGKRS
jgi:integrase